MTQKKEWERFSNMKITNPDDSFQHREVVKLLLMMKLQNKHKSNLSWIRIYSNFSIKEKRKVDIFFENIKTHEQYLFEIRKTTTDKWKSQAEKFFTQYKPLYFNFKHVLIPLKDLSTDIKQLNKQLDTYVI